MRPSLNARRMRFTLRILIGTLIAALAWLGVAAPATAGTSRFRGMNWSVVGDNFTTGQLVLDGLSITDSYDTVKAKANVVYGEMQSQLGINTVRLPVNTHTVGTAWWNNYRGAIDAATARGFKVILAYWADGTGTRGRVPDLAAFNAMWATVVAQYGSNARVYFEPMNEPFGYSSTEWRNFMANWLAINPSAVRSRVLVGGIGYDADLRDLCDDARFSGMLFSFHYYAFFYGTKTYDGWRDGATTRLGSCAARAVVTEFGAPMNSGYNYGDPNSTNNFVRYIRGITQVMRDNDLGGSYWPGIGGLTGTIGYDWYSMFAKSGTGTGIKLAVRSPSGALRVLYAFGDAVSGDGGVGTGSIINQNSGKCANIVSNSTANGAEIIQYTCVTDANERWSATETGDGYYEFVSGYTGKCMEVTDASTEDGASVTQNTCTGATNQQWELRAVGSAYQLVARHSGKCLDVPASSTSNGTRLKQYACTGGKNQLWTI